MKSFRELAIDFLTWIKGDKKVLIAEPAPKPPYEIVRIPTTMPLPKAPQSARSHAAMHQADPRSGDYVRHVNDVERQRFITRKLEPTDTNELPRIHKYKLTRYSGLYPGETAHRTPAFLRDKKIS